MVIRLLYLVVLSFSLTSCSKGDDIPQVSDANISFEMGLISSGKSVAKNESIIHPQGFSYRVDEFKVYLSNIQFTKENGDIVSIKFENRPGAEQGVFLYWLGRSENFKGWLPQGKYSKISFGLGLDTATNNLNPNQFNREHPLSRNTDMYWDMLKYRFLVLEGFSDINNSDNFNFIYTYHLGGDLFYRTLSLDIDLNVTEKSLSTVPLHFNLDRIFADGEDMIDMNTFFSYHSQAIGMETGLKMMDFLAASVQP
jgi:hypothetical protein